MAKKVTQRQKHELARRMAMGIALIERPLKHIAERDHTKKIVDGIVTVEMGPTYLAARQYANKGKGRVVSLMARHMVAA